MSLCLDGELPEEPCRWQSIHNNENISEQEGYLIIRRLISGSDLLELDRMIDRLLDGELKPVTAYEGSLPDHFYTFWEPQMKDRTELPRRDRVRLMSNMYHHHPYFRAVGGYPAIYDVISLLYQAPASTSYN